MNKTFLLDCGGLQLSYRFLYPETAGCFGDYLREGKEEAADIALSAEELQSYRSLLKETGGSDAFLEFQSLMAVTGNELLLHERALFHGAALLWEGKAWLLTAPSGTGKTTQLRHWRKLLRSEVKVINGDKPILACHPDGRIYVHSSPWRGKERYGQRGLSAPLGGIILLEQKEENAICRLEAPETVLPLFKSFISLPETRAQIEGQVQILRRILRTASVYKLSNKGDLSSAELTITTLKEQEVRR